MTYIYLIKCFDCATWKEYFPVAFNTKPEAEKYCKVNEKIHSDIKHTYVKIPVGAASTPPKPKGSHLEQEIIKMFLDNPSKNVISPGQFHRKFDDINPKIVNEILWDMACRRIIDFDWSWNIKRGELFPKK